MPALAHPAIPSASATLPLAPELDIADAPFSRRCHWLAFALKPETARNALYLRDARGGVIHRTLLRIELEHDGHPLPATLDVSAGRLTLSAPGTRAEFCLEGTATARVRLTGPATLRLQVVDQPYSSSLQCENGRWHLNLNASRTRLMVTRLHGDLAVEAPFIPGKSDTAPALLRLRATGATAAQGAAADSTPAELEITEFASTWLAHLPRPAFDTIAHAAEHEFATWFAAFGPFPARWAALARRAAYVLWANTAPASGHYAHPAILMSRNAMISIWSWDHCFDALALASAHPRQAWEQWWLPFALQTPEGMLPDAFTDASVDFGMTKPPVHGWALVTLLRHYTPTPTELEQAYTALERWTHWWLTHRDDDHDGIPQYNHGCESGWDNDSLCCGGLPCESADLAVYLIQQQHALAELATRLHRPAEATRWRTQARALLERLLAHSARAGRIIAPQSGTHAVGPQGDCLRQFWPLLLGPELPRELAQSLLADLLAPGRFRTPHGFATESPLSPHYRADGYWLGPIWAPSTYQIVEMLALHGHPDEARATALDFCALCERQGFRENFDALTGAGLRDPGYSWTAAVCFSFLQQERDRATLTALFPHTP